MFEDELFVLDDPEELLDGRDLFGLVIFDEWDAGLGALTAGLWLVTGAFLNVPPPFELGLLTWPKAEREIDNGRIKSSNVFIRVVLNWLINKSPR